MIVQKWSSSATVYPVRTLKGVAVDSLLINGNLRFLMNIVIPGGSGQIGGVLKRAFEANGDNVVVLSRESREPSSCWDGRTLGEWTKHIDGADVVINLAGRSVNCRYTEDNLSQMMGSRVESTRVVGDAIAKSATPPKVWLQMSTATIYSHRHDAANDDVDGVIGGSEPDAPAYWRRSINIAKAWESQLQNADTPQTRRVALRTAMVMSPDKDGVFDVLCGLTLRWLGGRIGSGRQFVSWIHETDFVNAIRLLINKESFSGPVNLASPHPLTQSEFQAELREALGVRFGLPATEWMAKIGAVILQTDTELILKSRRVVPRRLSALGFEFLYPHWKDAARELAKRRNELRANRSSKNRS